MTFKLKIMTMTKHSPFWKVAYSSKAFKQKKKMPKAVQAMLDILAGEIEKIGPIRKNWHNFGPLTGKNLPDNTYHCHLRKGRPTYVSCWYIVDKKLKQVEIFYVGTHESAPY